MFCTNCGEEMRATDKFCANCGAAAAPRPAKPRASTPASPEPSAPVRPSQSTTDAYRVPAPVPLRSAGNAQPSDRASSAPPQQTAPAAAPPVRQAAPPPAKAAPAAQAPLSSQQEQQALLEAEEIASVRDIAPAEVLPPELPPAAPIPATRECGFCGQSNPVGNRYCERCGQALKGAYPVQSAPAPAATAHSAWLDVPQPERKPAPSTVIKPVIPKSVPTPPVPATVGGKDQDFFYFYDDKSGQRSNLKLLVVLMVVLALGVLGVIYLMSRPSGKHAPAGNVTITLAPTEAQVSAGEAHDFSATVTGSGDTDVTWAVAEGDAGGKVVNHGAQAQGGAVASLGVYIAPTTPGTYHVVATSKADNSKSATAEVLVSGK